MSASATRSALARLIESARLLAREAPAVYLDTVAVLLRLGVAERALAELRKRCRSVQCRTSQACGAGYPFRLTMHQPQPEAIQMVADNLDHIVSEFHVSYDLPTRTQDDAAALTSIVSHLAVQPWHGTRKSRFVKGTTTYAAKHLHSGRNFAIYGDKPSKAMGGPCCHIEFRYDSAAVCKARGVRTCGDLLDYDATRYVDRDLKLGLIEWQAAFRVLRQDADRERRHRERSPKRGKVNARLNLIRRTFERLSSPLHWPSFDDTPRLRTQASLDVFPAWSSAVISEPITNLLSRAYMRAPAPAHSDTPQEFITHDFTDEIGPFPP